MFLSVTFFVILTCQPYEIHVLRACVPNTYFALNDRLCLCDPQGRYTEANCKTVARRQPCPPGQVIWKGCNQCICESNGQLKCTSAFCSNWVTKPGTSFHGLAEYGPNCTPFRSYYINCSLCFCPASGRASDAKCAVDTSCSIDHTSDFKTIKQNHCIPNVMYLFPCIQCLCSENGYFILDKCLEKCQSQTKYKRRCIPGTLYRQECDICRCPENSVFDEKLCIKTECNAITKQVHLQTLRSSAQLCTPLTFTASKCIYCDCTVEGTVNEHSCLEINCSKTSDFKYYKNMNICSPGEIVPICMECFCLNNGLTDEAYCTRSCSFQSKLIILEKVLNDSKVNPSIIDNTKIKTVGNRDTCEPNSLYINNNKYCICTDNGHTNFKVCTNVTVDFKYKYTKSDEIHFDPTTKCEPSTLVDFECNTCYCSKAGRIDPKWCTYDDCEAKRIVMESHKSRPNSESVEDSNGICTPGTISRVKCNFCICSDSGVLSELACTKNDCFENIEITDEKFVCEPLAYYEVDCNVCLCPRNGLKNVAKCTKNSCEKSALRSDSCIPGQLFSDDCNVCVCPPNGNKADRVCTNNTCSVSGWRIMKPSSLLENQIHDDATRNLDLCFPGEEFPVGCNLCVCPDLGLKVYASCEPILCDERKEGVIKSTMNDFDINQNAQLEKSTIQTMKHLNARSRIRRDVHDRCYIYEISRSAERKECSPGSLYIIRCRQCICPYLGNINNFCRPLPKSFFCEEAFPGFNYLSMGRRIEGKNNSSKVKSKTTKESITVTVKHLKHTTYKCSKPGKVMDECHICECEGDVVIEEHCFKSDAKNCSTATPTFLDVNKVVVV